MAVDKINGSWKVVVDQLVVDEMVVVKMVADKMVVEKWWLKKGATTLSIKKYIIMSFSIKGLFARW